MVYLRVTGRAMVNVHSANAEGAVGNYMALSKMFVVKRSESGYEISEEPVISGNMLKHWHAVAMVEVLKSWNYNKLCENCKRHVMYRSTLNLDNEFQYIQRCAIEDIHGFLATEKQIRRESLVKVSFMIPVEDQRAEYSSITFNRVVVNQKGSIPSREQAMMVMKREHASGIYGFLCSMDLGFAGVSLSDPSKRLPSDDVGIRVRAAIAALTDLLSGRFGAAQARSLPIMKVLELICIASRKPIPNAVHGFYKDYASETARIIKSAIEQKIVNTNDVKVVIVGNGVAAPFKDSGVTYEVVETAAEALSKVLEAVNNWLRSR